MPSPLQTTDLVDADGLRYVKKTAGTPFVAPSRGMESTMSCFKCGRHKKQSLLIAKRFLGKLHRVCKDGCC